MDLDGMRALCGDKEREALAEPWWQDGLAICERLRAEFLQ